MDSDETELVTKALQAEGVEATPTEEGWLTFFQINQTKVVVFLFDGGSGYFVCAAPINSDALKVTLNNLKAERVRTLLRLGSEIRMAKVEYQEIEGKPFYYAVSDCALEGYSGVKLKNRLHACAKLSALISSKIA